MRPLNFDITEDLEKSAKKEKNSLSYMEGNSRESLTKAFDVETRPSHAPYRG